MRNGCRVQTAVLTQTLVSAHAATAGWKMRTRPASTGETPSVDGPPELQEVEVVSTWKILVSFSVMTTVSLLVIVLFSDTVDTGREVVNGLLEYAAAGASTSVFACMCVVALVLYVCDISYWSGTIGALARRIMLLLLALATYAFGLSMVRTHPYFPLTLFIFTLPLAALSLRMTALRRCSAAGASWVLGCAFLFAAFVCLLVWVLWLYGAINGERQFWFSNRLRFSNAAQCNTTEFEPAGLVEVHGIPRCIAA